MTFTQKKMNEVEQVEIRRSSFISRRLYESEWEPREEERILSGHTNQFGMLAHNDVE